MTEPPRKQSVAISAVAIAILILLLVASTIAVLTFTFSKVQAPQEGQEIGVNADFAVTCRSACRDCSSKEYDARCFDRCRFGFKPYCD